MSVKQLIEERIKQKDLNIAFPLRKGTRGALQTNKLTRDAVRDDLKILILTNHGERLVHGDFGANLRGLIFENMSDDLNAQIENAIVTAVAKWMPFVTVNNIDIKDYTRDSSLPLNAIKLNISFSINGTDLDDSLEVTIKV